MINCTKELAATEARKGHRLGKEMPHYVIW